MVRGIFTRCLYCCLLLFLTNLKTLNTTFQGDGNDNAGKITGDIVLGGLFRVHHNKGTKGCGEKIELEVGIQRVEAMVYAIEQVNKDTNLLPNVTLGAEIRDTCGLGNVALDESLKFILDSISLHRSSRTGHDCMGNVLKDVVGVVGASRSSLSIEVANLFRLFKVPQVSYASTSAELSDSEKYSYFARTVPPDKLQALAMLDIINKFNWTSVFAVNSAGSYGEKGIEQFKTLAKSKNSSVCIVSSHQVSDKHDSEHYDKIINTFSRLSSTQVVVLFMKDNHVKKLLQSAQRMKYNKIVWVASDEWGTRVDIVEHMGNYFDDADAVTITLESTSLPEFENYFKKINSSMKRKANPWFQQYWEQNCNWTCNITKFNDKLPYVINAVYTFAHALHEMYHEKCPNMTGLCQAMKPVNGTELRDRILKVHFQGISQDIVAFDENGDSKGKYRLFHYTRQGYKSFGVWQDGLNLTTIPTNLEDIVSSCSEECKPSSRRLLKKGTACCFTCSDCPRRHRQYVNVNDQTCVDCEKDQRPNANYTGCEDLPTRYIPDDWIIVVSLLAGLGLLCTLIVIALFLFNINTPIVKASGRDLTFPLLAGVLLNYVMTFFLVSKPAVVICAIQRFGYGFSASVCYAAILIKTNRIARIFANKNLKAVNFTKPHTQLVILVLLIGIEVSLVSVGLIMKPPRIIKVLPSAEDILAKCNFTKLDYAISLPYNLLLVILCTVYTFRTRKTPSKFNEAKYLGFVMYTTCIIWIAFLPVYYGTEENYQPIALSLNSTLNATTILACLFGPKVYILVFKPARNVENSKAMTSHSMLDLSSTAQGNRINASSWSLHPVVVQEATSNRPNTIEETSKIANSGNKVSTNNSSERPKPLQCGNNKDSDLQNEESEDKN